MTIKEFKEEIIADKELKILDVRMPEEFVGNLDKIPNAMNIPVQQLSFRVDELDPFKGNKIAVICRSGVRSRAAVAILKENGFNAINVDGGMLAYAEK
ncbi:MAG: rhodanese-like domain-containing protein [Bacteroidota bacterium]|nr:rhodanese-like domain-containing protein [Bacteroidota bacterium]